MPQLETLGGVLTCGLLLFAIFFVPIKLARVWGPVVRDKLMSIFGGAPEPIAPVADRLPATSTIEVQPIATPGNVVNDRLTGNGIAHVLDNTSPDITEAREIMRFQKGVEDAVSIIQLGKIGQTEVIEAIFKCKRSGRADSLYQKARAAVLAQLGPERPMYYDDLRAKIEAETEAKTA